MKPKRFACVEDTFRIGVLETLGSTKASAELKKSTKQESDVASVVTERLNIMAFILTTVSGVAYEIVEKEKKEEKQEVMNE